MGFYLLENKNPNGDHFYTTRRGRVLAIVVHITAGLEDLDATDDMSAEQTARYAATTDRAVSWHSGSDADSALDLLPDTYTAFQCQGYNSTTYGHEISKRHTDWRWMPEPWRTRTLTVAARHLAPKAAVLGVPRRHATRVELDRAIASGGAPVGFVGHWELDPSRRSDPGLVGRLDTFPWTEFFALMGATANIPASQESDVFKLAINKTDRGVPWAIYSTSAPFWLSLDDMLLGEGYADATYKLFVNQVGMEPAGPAAEMERLDFNLLAQAMRAGARSTR